MSFEQKSPIYLTAILFCETTISETAARTYSKQLGKFQNEYWLPKNSLIQLLKRMI